MDYKKVNQERGILVSPEDEDLIINHSWPLGLGYARRTNRERHTVNLHRIILERMLGRPLSPREFVDHINRNKVDNRRENLRLATPSQNGGNSIPFGSSGYKGVRATKYGYMARICKDRKLHYLGTFDTPQDAHNAYKAAARKYFGEFARFE